MAASAKGNGDVRRSLLGRALHQERALPISGSVGRVVVVSTEEPFRALISTETELPRGRIRVGFASRRLAFIGGSCSAWGQGAATAVTTLAPR